MFFSATLSDSFRQQQFTQTAQPVLTTVAGEVNVTPEQAAILMKSAFVSDSSKTSIAGGAWDVSKGYHSYFVQSLDAQAAFDSLCRHIADQDADQQREKAKKEVLLRQTIAANREKYLHNEATVLRVYGYNNPIWAQSDFDQETLDFIKAAQENEAQRRRDQAAREVAQKKEAQVKIDQQREEWIRANGSECLKLKVKFDQDYRVKAAAEHILKSIGGKKAWSYDNNDENHEEWKDADCATLKLAERINAIIDEDESLDFYHICGQNKICITSNLFNKTVVVWFDEK